MTKTRASILAIATFAVGAVCVTPARADEGHSYYGRTGYIAEFFLIGGQYHIYVNARFGVPTTRLVHSCMFTGHFSRLLPDPDTLHWGPTQIATAIPYRLDLKSVALPAGLYRLYVASGTDCEWKFFIVSGEDNSSGLASVQMVKMHGGDWHLTANAALADTVEFSADFRSDHNKVEQVSGMMQILHDQEIVRSVPLQFGSQLPLRSNFFYGNVQWGPGDVKYLGKNTVKFMVKIGPKEFTSSGEFTLTQ